MPTQYLRSRLLSDLTERKLRNKNYNTTPNPAKAHAQCWAQFYLAGWPVSKLQGGLSRRTEVSDSPYTRICYSYKSVVGNSHNLNRETKVRTMMAANWASTVTCFDEYFIILSVNPNLSIKSFVLN